ncbi:hypothetical protein NW762_012839 [Fusarium torreyae]|uniref:Uncharacterized protein n=1 Tax=Fusarium torreyae TaxID=1237075 RepID=A0A9W8RN26_9HYPO|nr:hypothetical protein NW762_012839 [Fusarium torreyae]
MSKSPRLEPIVDSEQPILKQAKEANAVIPFYLTPNGADDNPLYDDETEDITTQLYQLKLIRENKDKYQASIGRRVATKVRVHHKKWCCDCGRYGVKGSKCRLCGHDVCDTCKEQHRRDKDKNGPSCITMGPIEEEFRL